MSEGAEPAPVPCARSGDERGAARHAQWLATAATEVVLPAVVGALTGLAVGFLTRLIEGKFLGFIVTLESAWVALVPLAALPLTWVFTRFLAHADRRSTSEFYIEVFHDPEKRLPLRQAPGRYLAGAATVGFGGSQGLESPSTLLGASVGTVLERTWPRLFAKEKRGHLLAAGASAGIAAVFSSPGAGALFGIEAPYRRGLDAKALVPSIVAAGTGYLANIAVRGPTPFVPPQVLEGVDVTTCLAALGIAVVCGFGARGFAVLSERARALAQRSTIVQRALWGSLPLVPLAWLGWTLTGTWVSLGPGNVAVRWGLETHPVPWLLLLAAFLHSLGTVSCVYGGGGGGQFRALATAGALIGQFVAVMLGRPDMMVFALVGTACFLGAGYRIPLSGVLLVAEGTSGAWGVVLGLVCVGVAYACMGEQTTAPAQR